MPSDHPFISFGRNAEDVVLHRALGEVADGRFVEIRAGDPTEASVGRAFSDRGWTGIALSAAEVRSRRLDDVLAERLGQGEEIQFLVVDTAGSEHAVLAGVDLRRWHPWVLVVRATESESGRQTHEQWEPGVLDAGYEFCLFDGVSRFYVAAERADALRAALSYPANERDRFVPSRWQALGDELTRLRAAHDDTLEQLDRWRGRVLARWSEVAAGSAGTSSGRGTHEVVRLKEELAAMRATVSWRITAPLRAVQSRRLREWR